MKIIEPSVEINWFTPNPLEVIEKIGRVCYRSEEKIQPGSAEKFVARLLKNDHLAMIEHASISMTFVCDLGVSHCLVRHRLFSFAQESTQYCDYANKEIEFICPPGITLTQQMLINGELDTKVNDLDIATYTWYIHMKNSEDKYKVLRENKNAPQVARSVLPKSLATKLVITGNLREWLHFFKLRTSKFEQTLTQKIANMALTKARSIVPIVFDNIHN